MRRIAVLSLATALLGAAPAPAATVLVLDHGRVWRQSLPLPPPDPRPARDTTSRAALRSATAHIAATPKRTVRGELARLRDAAAIDQATYDADIGIWDDAQRTLRKLTGRRFTELRAVLATADDLAARGLLSSGRAPLLFQTVARNRQWWATGSLLGYGQRARFAGSQLVWQSYPGQGIQIQWLGTFGFANALETTTTPAKQRRLGALLDEAVALATPRAGGVAWESLFGFDGGRPPWVSSLSQGTAIQALSRSAIHLRRPEFFAPAREGLGIFGVAPPEGVRVATSAGAHYLQYSFAPRLRILNGFVQSLNGLFDFAKLANDESGRALFAAGAAEAASEVPRYDTGAWSLYDGVHESTLGYHDLLRQFLDGLCERTATAAFCSTAADFKAQLTQPPAIVLLSTRGRAGKPVPVRFTVSKISRMVLSVDGAAVASSTVGHGRRTFVWRGRRAPGTVALALTATDLAGNRSSTSGTLTLRRP